MHLNDGELLNTLENETGSLPVHSHHLQTCAACQQRLSLIKARSQVVRQKMDSLAPPHFQAAWSHRYKPRQALSRFNLQRTQSKETNVHINFRSKALWAVVTSIIILVGVLSFPTGRAWAGQLLSLFRVQQVTVLPIDTSSFTAMGANQATGQQISQLLSDSIQVNQKPGDPQTAADAAAASKLAGFNVRLPVGESAPTLTVMGGSNFDFTVNLARAQAILNEAGHADLVLPKSIDGEKVSANIPSSVSAGYGVCPDPAVKNPTGSYGRQNADCTQFMQIPSPSVETPADMDITKLVEIGLEFTGMSPAQAQEYSQTIDWKTSLVIPLPKNAATYQIVTVDGVNGTLIQRPVDDAPEYVLVWVKNGIIYAISAPGSDSAHAIQMANSLQ